MITFILKLNKVLNVSVAVHDFYQDNTKVASKVKTPFDPNVYRGGTEKEGRRWDNQCEHYCYLLLLCLKVLKC